MSPAGWIARLLRFPLRGKILVANAAIVAAVLGLAWIAHPTDVEFPTGLFVTIALAALATTVLVNLAILRIALRPLRRLQETAARLRSGDLQARAPLSSLADRRTRELIEAFNETLDGVEDYRRRLRAMTARVVSREEEVRMEVARELHEETAQRLASLLLRLRLKSREGDPEGLRRLAEEARGEIATALETIRGYAADRQPPPLEELGLGRAVESHARSIAETAGVGIRVSCASVDRELPPAGRLVLYRIVQEALENAASHARASEIDVRIEPENGRVVARVTDDGEGFDVEETMNRGGIGLFGMHERAAMVGGSVEIDSDPGAGTTVTASVPVEDPEEGGRT